MAKHVSWNAFNEARNREHSELWLLTHGLFEAQEYVLYESGFWNPSRLVNCWVTNYMYRLKSTTLLLCTVQGPASYVQILTGLIKAWQSQIKQWLCKTCLQANTLMVYDTVTCTFACRITQGLGFEFCHPKCSTCMHSTRTNYTNHFISVACLWNVNEDILKWFSRSWNQLQVLQHSADLGLQKNGLRQILGQPFCALTHICAVRVHSYALIV